MESNRPIARGERLTLPGPAGVLDALIEIPASPEPLAIGVICHPHPLYGGALENKVVHTVAHSLRELGAATLRFNFRGVGASAGVFADGIGETDDALAMIAAGRARFPNLPLWLAGFSFGGAVAVRAAQSAAPRLLVTVAPAVRLMNLNDIKAPDCPWLIVQGDDDELVDAQDVLSWAARLTPAPQVSVLSGVGHFFHGRLRELDRVVVDFARERTLAQRE